MKFLHSIFQEIFSTIFGNEFLKITATSVTQTPNNYKTDRYPVAVTDTTKSNVSYQNLAHDTKINKF